MHCAYIRIEKKININQEYTSFSYLKFNNIFLIISVCTRNKFKKIIMTSLYTL